MARATLRRATLADLDLLVRHRRMMSEEDFGTPGPQLDALDSLYRRWVRTRLRSGRLVGFVIEEAGGRAAASGCLWIMPVQPHALWRGVSAPYLMSMYTEKEDRGKGHATRITREAIRWSRDHGYSRIFLHASKYGRNLYERLGFVQAPQMRLSLDGEPAAAQKRARQRATRGKRRRTSH